MFSSPYLRGNLKKKKVTSKGIFIKKVKKVAKEKTVKKNIKVEKKKKTFLKKKPKQFDDYIEEIFSKLVTKHKIDGIYTSKIIQKSG